MGEVLQFPGGGNNRYNPITTEELCVAITSHLTEETIQAAIREVVKSDSYKIPPLSKLTQPINNDAKEGECHHVLPNGSKKNEGFLVINENFPEYLRRNEVDREDALVAAAVYARSLDAVSQGIARARAWHGNDATFKKSKYTRHPEYWCRGENNSDYSVAHRAAGTVLMYTGFDFDTADKPCYPMHIAGMMDPLVLRSGSGSILNLQERLTQQ